MSLTGALAKQELAQYVPLLKKTVYHGIIQHEELDVPITAFDQEAETLANYRPGSIVCIHGRLCQHRWKTSEGKKREQLEVQVETVELISEPKTYTK